MADAARARLAEVLAHALEDGGQWGACDAAEGERHEVAGRDRARAVDVEVGQPGAAAEGLGRLDVGEGGKGGQGVVLRHAGLVVQDALGVPGRELGLGLVLEPADGTGLEQVDLVGAAVAGEAQEGEEPALFQERRAGHGHDVGVKARLAGRAQGRQSGLERAGDPPSLVVFGLILRVEADAHGEEPPRFQGRGALRGQPRARGAQGEVEARVEGRDDLLEVLAQKGLAAGEGDADRAEAGQLAGQLAQALQREVLLAAPGVVAVPALVGAAVGHGQGDRVQAPLRARAGLAEAFGEAVEGRAGVGGEVRVDHDAVPEADGLLARQVVLEERGHAGVQLGEGRPRGHLPEEVVSAHKVLLPAL